MHTPGKSNPLKQSFGFQYAFVKFKLKTAMAISLQLKVTIPFFSPPHTNIWFKQSSKKYKRAEHFLQLRKAGWKAPSLKPRPTQQDCIDHLAIKVVKKSFI